MQIQSYQDLMHKSLIITTLLFVLGVILLGAGLGFSFGIILYMSALLFLPTLILTFFYLILDTAVFSGLFPGLLSRFLFSLFIAVVIFLLIVLIDMWIGYPITFAYSVDQMYFFLLMALSAISIHFLLERFWYRTKNRKRI